MVIETEIKPNIDLQIFEHIAADNFRQRQIGRLIATTIATTDRRMDYDSRVRKTKALIELSQYFPAKRLTRFVAQIQDPIAYRQSVVRLLLLYP